MTATFCPGCLNWQPQLKLDKLGRPRGCPTCWSLERHRLLALLLPVVAAHAHPAAATEAAETAETGPSLAVDVAPSRALDPVLARLEGFRRVRLDFDPGADGRLVDVRASVTALPFADASVDLLVCSHVLEHVPDDAAAIRDIARVLAPKGLGVVLVPWRAGPTDEDPNASVEERLRRFGQADHVRYYGDDFEHRLAVAGLVDLRLESRDVVDPWIVTLLGLVSTEPFWLVRRSDSPHPLPTADGLRDGVHQQLAESLSTAGTRPADGGHLSADAERWRLEAERWQRQYRKLRGRRAVRALSSVDRMRKRLRVGRR